MKPKIIIPLGIALVVGLVFYINLTALPTGFQDLDTVGAQVMLAQNPDARIIDIRTPAEFAEGHLEGAEIIDFYAPGYREKWAALDRDATYFVYCRTGNRSGKTMSMLAELGFTRILHLKDGIVSWQRVGLPVVK